MGIGEGDSNPSVLEADLRSADVELDRAAGCASC